MRSTDLRPTIAETTDAEIAVTTETVKDAVVVLRAQEARELQEKEDANNVNAEES